MLSICLCGDGVAHELANIPAELESDLEQRLGDDASIHLLASHPG